MPKKGLFILMGECFREAMPTSRLRDTEYGIKNQTESSISHEMLAKRLRGLNYDIELAIHTYKTNHRDRLLNFYTNVVYQHFSDHYHSNELKDVVSWALNSVFSQLNMDNYDFIFVCRLDLLLKPDLINIFNPEWNQIIYPNLMHYWNKHYHISDVFVFIPKKYYYDVNDTWKGLLANSTKILHHHAMAEIIQNGLTVDDIDFVSDRMYIANTYQMSNPLYKINCRPEGVDDHKHIELRKHAFDKALDIVKNIG
jgi:hypothetical protein